MIKWNKKLCDLCGICVSVCPENAIEMFANYLEIDRNQCTICRKCVKICPVKALSDEEEDENA